MHWFGFVAAGGVLMALGFLAYVLLDPYGPPLGDWDCGDAARCAVPAWRDPGAVQGVLVVLGFFGMGLLVWGLVLRGREDAP